MSKRNFIRRFKKATNNLPVEYIQKIKIEAAKRSLELRRKNVNEVMYSVGYNDVKAFRTNYGLQSFGISTEILKFQHVKNQTCRCLSILFCSKIY